MIEAAVGDPGAGASSLFQRDGVVQRINPYKQGSVAKELNISISDGKRLF